VILYQISIYISRFVLKKENQITKKWN
jgi:Sec-independent protein secretion pathway component TatC